VRHLNSIQLCAFLDDVLVGAPDDESARHLATCAICRTRYESWCHVDDSLRELLGQDPDEHAMEQRMAWVQVAVAAERKGVPAPEFSELRIPVPPPAPAPPPVQVFPPGRAPAPPKGHTPLPREPVKRPVLQSPILQPPAPAQQASAPRPSAPAPAFDAPRAPAPVVAPPPPPDARGPGYARMPRPPRKGLAAFFGRPFVWLAFALVVAFAVALPMGVKRFGIPEIKFGFHPAHEKESDVKKAAADETTDREDDAEPARPMKSHASTSPDAQPDASVLFDLPALEPEDGEPDPGTGSSPKSSAPSSSHASAPRGGPMLCGEVRNTQGQPIEGARVFLVSPSRMVRTDRNGKFCLVCSSGKHTIRIEASGRATVTRTVQVGRDRLETRFTLNAEN
jgi:hypothetical protein